MLASRLTHACCCCCCATCKPAACRIHVSAWGGWCWIGWAWQLDRVVLWGKDCGCSHCINQHGEDRSRLTEYGLTGCLVLLCNRQARRMSCPCECLGLLVTFWVGSGWAWL